jgi:hypothetical protein
MLRNKLLLIGLAAASLAFAVQPASAQATRTWVSGVGDDVNPCSRTAPCKTFAGAISKTAAGGEISVLDPGGFGAVTITKSITIDGGGGQVTSTLVSGTNGIVISAPATATVTLRNIRINGIGGSTTGGLNGIQFLAGGALHVEHCTIFGFTQNAININLNSATAVNVFVTDTVISNSVGGLTARNAGAGNLFVSAQRTTFVQNTSFGLRADGSGGAGTLIITASDSLMAGNGAGVTAVGGPAATAGIQVTRSTIMTNTTAGLLANGTSGPAFIFSSNNLITGNFVGMSTVAGGNILTYRNNATDGNFNTGAFTGQITPE